MSGSWPLPGGLPPGRLIVADPRYAYGEPVTEPVLWVTDHLVPDAGPLWARLLAEHPGTRFEVELTEATLVADPGRVRATLERIAAL